MGRIADEIRARLAALQSDPEYHAEKAAMTTDAPADAEMREALVHLANGVSDYVLGIGGARGVVDIILAELRRRGAWLPVDPLPMNGRVEKVACDSMVGNCPRARLDREYAKAMAWQVATDVITAALAARKL